jgi:hypothetical protein
VTSPEANRAEGLCGGAARRSAAEPEPPSEAAMHIRAVICSCAIVLIPSRHHHLEWKGVSRNYYHHLQALIHNETSPITNAIRLIL